MQLRPYWFGVLCLGSALPSGCGEPGSPEDRVREVIARAEAAAESRDVSDVMGLVAESYADRRGQDKAAIRELMHGYFLINQSIHLLINVEDIEFPSGQLATARVTVGMLGRQAAEDWSFAADVYEFDIRLRDVEGEWLLQSADWRRTADR